MSLQAIVPRTSEATQVQHNMNQQSAVQQDFQAVRDKQETALKQTQVRKKDQGRSRSPQEAGTRPARLWRRQACRTGGGSADGEVRRRCIPRTQY